MAAEATGVRGRLGLALRGVQISAPPEAWGLLEAPAHQKRQAAAAEEHGAVTSSQLEGAALAAAAEVATAAVRLPEASTAAAAEAASVAAAIAAADEAEAVHQVEAFKVAEAAEAADVAMAVAASLAEPAQAATDEEEEAAMAMAVAASLAPVAPPAVPLSKAEGKRVAGAASAPGAGGCEAVCSAAAAATPSGVTVLATTSPWRPGGGLLARDAESSAEAEAGAGGGMAGAVEEGATSTAVAGRPAAEEALAEPMAVDGEPAAAAPPNTPLQPGKVNRDGTPKLGKLNKLEVSEQLVVRGLSTEGTKEELKVRLATAVGAEREATKAEEAAAKRAKVAGGGGSCAGGTGCGDDCCHGCSSGGNAVGAGSGGSGAGVDGGSTPPPRVCCPRLAGRHGCCATVGTGGGDFGSAVEYHSFKQLAQHVNNSIRDHADVSFQEMLDAGLARCPCCNTYFPFVGGANSGWRAHVREAVKRCKAHAEFEGTQAAGWAAAEAEDYKRRVTPGSPADYFLRVAATRTGSAPRPEELGRREARWQESRAREAARAAQTAAAQARDAAACRSSGERLGGERARAR